ncbi:MAG: 50S ribosomal protein L25 [candidate division FCPU426 bacterium]
MKQVQLIANARTTLKKNEMNRLRDQTWIPAVLYGQGASNVNLQIQEKVLQQAIHTPAGLNVLVKLNIEGASEAQEETVMIKSLQRHPVTSKVLHVDLVRISMDKPLETTVPIMLTGTAPGIKEGGNLEQVHRDLAIRCLPALLPEQLTVDVSALAIGDAVTVKQLRETLPAGIEILVDEHEPIVHVVAPRLEEEKPAEAAAVPGVAGAAVAAAPAAEPEVIGEKEREQRRLEREKEKDQKK